MMVNFAKTVAVIGALATVSFTGEARATFGKPEPSREPITNPYPSPFQSVEELKKALGDKLNKEVEHKLKMVLENALQDQKSLDEALSNSTTAKDQVAVSYRMYKLVNCYCKIGYILNINKQQKNSERSAIISKVFLTAEDFTSNAINRLKGESGTEVSILRSDFYAKNASIAAAQGRFGDVVVFYEKSEKSLQSAKRELSDLKANATDENRKRDLTLQLSQIDRTLVARFLQYSEDAIHSGINRQENKMNEVVKRALLHYISNNVPYNESLAIDDYQFGRAGMLLASVLVTEAEKLNTEGKKNKADNENSIILASTAYKLAVAAERFMVALKISPDLFPEYSNVKGDVKKRVSEILNDDNMKKIDASVLDTNVFRTLIDIINEQGKKAFPQ